MATSFGYHDYTIFIRKFKDYLTLVTSFVVLNVFIGIIVGTMSEVAAENKVTETAPFDDKPDREEALARELSLFKEQLIRVQTLLNRPE